MMYIYLVKIRHKEKSTDNLLDINNEVGLEVNTEKRNVYSCFMKKFGQKHKANTQ